MDEPADFQSFIHSYSSGLLEVHATSAAPVSRVYLISHPMPGNISAIKISIVSHDQGSTAADTEISNTWFDASILRPIVSTGKEGKPKLPSASSLTNILGCSEPFDLWWEFKRLGWLLVDEVQGRDVFRVCTNSISSEWQTHEVLWSAGTLSDTDDNSGKSLMDTLKEDDRIAIWARAKDLNWKNFVQHIRIEVTLAESRRIGFREWLPHCYDPVRVPDLDEDDLDEDDLDEDDLDEDDLDEDDVDEGKTFFGSVGIPLDGDLSDEEVFEKHGFRWSIEEYKTWSQHHVGGRDRKEPQPGGSEELNSMLLALNISAEPSDPCQCCGLPLSDQFSTCVACQKRVCFSCGRAGEMNRHRLTSRCIFNQDVEKFVKDGGGIEDATNTTARRLRNENYAYYKPLDPHSREIRLLSIMPSHNDDEPLSCFLTNETISGLSYVALSYCWGDMEKQEGITVSHASRKSNKILLEPFRALRVTENLFNALKSIRRTLRIRGECYPKVKFWIDALCINQGDNAERAQQVGLMDQIYANAYQVWIWIGDSEETQSVMKLMGRFGVKAHRIFERRTHQDLQRWARQKFFSTLTYLRCDGETNYGVFSEICSEVDKAGHTKRDYGKFMWAFLHMMTQPWFQRIWVLQEVFCAKGPVFFYAGLGHLVNFDTILLGNHYLTFREWGSYRSFENIDNRIPLAWRDLFSMLHQRHREKSADGGMTLLELFRHTCHFFEATDPRDKLFGLLGLARETSQTGSSSNRTVLERLAVDYGKSTSEVFCNLTLWCIEHYKNLDVLSLVGETNCHFLPSYGLPRSSNDYDRDLPSWALWHRGKPHQLCGNFTLGNQSFNVSGKRDVDVVALQSNNRCILTLKGIRVGIVKSVSLGVLRTMDKNEESDESPSMELYVFDYRTYGYVAFPMNMLWGVANSRYTKMEGRPTHHWLGHTESAYKGDEEDMFRDFLETIMLRTPEPGKGNIWEEEGTAHRLALYWKQHDPELQQLPPSVRDIMEPLVTKDATWGLHDDFISQVPIPGKVLFMSDEWRLGLCPAETEAGDVIVVLFGGKVPFILRPKQSVPLPDQMDGQEWVFVGECFVHGRMHSGVVDEKLRQNVPIENFHLV